MGDWTQVVISNYLMFYTISLLLTDLLSNSPKRSLQFSPSYEGTDNMFYFFYKNHFRRNKEKGDVRSTYVCFTFVHKTVNSHNL